MSDEQTNCMKCGVRILVLTARETGGVCMVCSRGTREEFDARRARAKQYYAEQAAYRQSEQYQYWVKLVSAVGENGIGSLSEPEQIFFAVCILQGEVFNGGLHQFFANSSGDYYVVSERGLDALGASAALGIVREAKTLLFGADPVPDWEGRNARLDELENEPVADSRLSALTRALNDQGDELAALVQQYALNNGLFEPFDPASV